MIKFQSLFLIILLFACTNKEQEVEKNDKEKVDNSTFEERVKREIEAKLSIPVTEKYSIKIYKEHLNGDEKIDAIITVNRLGFAMEEASNSTNAAKRAELGYMGNYNFFFYYDGALDRLSIPIQIASSSKAPLEVKFENIQSEIYKDVQIEYRIRNSKFRNYYLIESGSLVLVFQWKLFDQVGLENYEANYLSYAIGSFSLAKDIVIHKGKIKNYKTKIEDIYTYEPVIEKTNEELYHFFYDPKTFKYMTKIK